MRQRMVAVTLLLVAVSIWLFWEWRTGALAPRAEVAGRREPATIASTGRSLPTSGALNADAQVAARQEPPL
jgi:hypothetical protein